MRIAAAAFLLACGSCAVSAPTTEENGFRFESVDAVLARLESAIASNDAWIQSREVSRDFRPSYDGLLDQIRTSAQTYDVERLRLLPNHVARDSASGDLAIDARFDLRRRARTNGAVEDIPGTVRLRFRREGDRYRLVQQDGEALLGRP